MRADRLTKKATEDLGIQTTNMYNYVVKAGSTYKYLIPLVLPTWVEHGNDHRFCKTNTGVSALQNTRKKFNSLRTCNVHGAEISVIITTKPMVLVSTDAAIPLFWLQATLLTLKTPYAMLQGTLKSSRIKNSTIPSGDEYKLFQIDFGLDGRENIYLPWRIDGRGQTLAQILNKETWCCSITNLHTEIICH